MFSSEVKIISATSQKENYKRESSSSGVKHIKNQQQHQNYHHQTQKSHHCHKNNNINNNNNNNFNQLHNANINVNNNNNHNNNSNNHRIKKSNNSNKIQSARKKIFVNNNNSYNSNNSNSNTNNNNSVAKNQNIISSNKGFSSNNNIGNIKDFQKYNSKNNLQENYVRNSKQTGYNNLSYINPLQVLMVMSDTSNTIIEKNNNVNNAVTKSNDKRNKSTNNINNNNNSNNNINNYNSINTNINNTSNNNINNNNNNNNNCSNSNINISNNNDTKLLKTVPLQSSNLAPSTTSVTAPVATAPTVGRAPFPGNNTVTIANITATTKQQSSNIEDPIAVTPSALSSTNATPKSGTTIEVANTITDTTTSTITTTTTGNSSPSRGGISSQSSQASYSLDFLHSVGIQMTAGSNRTYSSPSSPRHSPYINSGRHRCAIAYSQEHPGGLLTDHQIASTYSKSSLKDRNFETPILHHPAVASRSLASPLHGGVSPSFLYNPHNYPQSTNFFHHHNHSPYYHHHQQNLHYHNMNAMAHPFPPMRNHSLKKNWNWTPPNVASSVAATTMASNGAMTASSIAAASTVKRYNNSNNTNYGNNNNCSSNIANPGGCNIDKGANGNGNYSSMSNLNKFGSLPSNNSSNINNNNNGADSNVQGLPRARSHQNIKNLTYILSENNADSYNGNNHIDSGLGTGTSGSGATTNTGRYNIGNSRPSTPSTKSESPSIHRTSSITHQQQQQQQQLQQQGNIVTNLQQSSTNHQQQMGIMDHNAHSMMALPGGQGSQQQHPQYPQTMSTDISAANSTINGYESDSSHSSCRRSEYEFRIKNHRTAGQGPTYQMGEMMSLLNFPTYSDEDIPKHHQPSFYGSHQNLMFWNTINPNYATHSIYNPAGQITSDCGTNQYITDSKRSQSQNRTYRGRRQLYTSFRAHSYHENFYTPPDKFLAKAHLVEVKMAPETLMNGSKWDQLSQGIWNKFVMAQQTEETYKKKMYLWRYLYITIKKAYPRYGLYLVGSTISGFGADTSDVDMCLVSRNVSNIDPRMEALCNLTVLKEYLLQSGAFEQFNLIEAKVPILRFKDSMHMLEVDLNFNNCVGIRNTHLLHCYSQLDWRLRPLVLVAKLWAQFHNINNAKNMTISSYSLALMVIHFLQYAVQPPVLPCLHEMFPEKFQIILKSNDFGFVDMTEDIGPYESQNNQTLGELFLQFLEYYSNFDYAQYAISVRTGSVLPVEICRQAKSIKNDVHQWKELCIEEPFDLTNTARSVYDCETFERVKAVFVKSWKVLEATLDLNSIFAPIIHQNPSSSLATSQVPLNMHPANLS